MKLVTKPTTEEKVFDNTMYCGLETFTIVKVNPTKKELNALYGKEDSEEDSEIEYVDEKDGDERIRISVYLKGKETERITRVNFFIVDRERTSKPKDGDEDNVKYQFINQVCQASFAKDEKDLADWFTKFTDKDKNVLGVKSFRKALEGEAEFYDFVRNVMSKTNFFDPGTDVKFDMKKMRKGNFTELNDVLTNEDYSGSFVAMNYIKSSLDSTKEYNEVFVKAIIKPTLFEKVKPLLDTYYKMSLKSIVESDRFKDIPVVTVEDIYGYVEDNPTIALKNVFDAKNWAKFFEELTGPYGCKGFFKFAPVFPYNSDMNPVTGNSPLTSDSSY